MACLRCRWGIFPADFPLVDLSDIRRKPPQPDGIARTAARQACGGLRGCDRELCRIDFASGMRGRGHAEEHDAAVDLAHGGARGRGSNAAYVYAVPIGTRTHRSIDEKYGYRLDPALGDVGKAGFRDPPGAGHDFQVAAIGDSMTYGNNVDSAHSWPLLSRQ